MKRKEREELKHDRFVETLVGLGRFFQTHRRPFIAAGLAVTVAVGALFYAAAARRAAREARRVRLYAAMNAVRDALRRDKPKEKEEALAKALTRLRHLHDEAPDSPEALQALRFIGDVYYLEGKYNRAIEVYRALFNTPNAPARLRALTKMALAAALEQSGDWLAAAELHRERTQTERLPEEIARAWLDYARCMDRLDRREEAVRARQKASEAAPESFWARMAQALAAMPEPPEAPVPVPPGQAPEPSKRPEVEGQAAPFGGGEPAPKAPSTRPEAPAPASEEQGT